MENILVVGNDSPFACCSVAAYRFAAILCNPEERCSQDMFDLFCRQVGEGMAEEEMT